MKGPFYITTVALISSLSGFSFAQEANSPAVSTTVADSVQTVSVQTDSVQAVPVQADSVQTASVQADSVQAVPVQTDSVQTASVQADSVQAVPVQNDSLAAAVADSTAEVDSVADDTTAVIDTVATVDTAAAAVDTAAVVDTAKVADSVVVAEVPQEDIVVMAEGTPLQGELQGYLKADKSPYIISENISISKNSMLVIEPGVQLLFAPNASFNVNGQLIVAGTPEEPVIFGAASRGAKKFDPWKGIVIVSEEQSEIRNAKILEAQNGIVLENSSLLVSNTSVEKTTGRGIYAKNSKISVADSKFSFNAGAALQVASYSTADIKRVKFDNNRVALYNSILAITEIETSSFEKNGYAILDMGNSILNFTNSIVKDNETGAVSDELLNKSVTESVLGNKANFVKESWSVAAILPANPEIPGVESRPVIVTDRVNDLIVTTTEQVVDTTQKSWTIMGNAMLGSNYHYVRTRRNDNEETDVIVGSDTIKAGKKYRNTFQVPNFGAEAAAYLYIQSPDGKTIEFSADMTRDDWNHFSPNPVTLSYKDKYNQAVIGDFQKNEGEIYMSNLPLFGAGYTLSLLTNNANKPLFEVGGFFGEARKPYLPGEKHPYIYNNYINESSSQAQRIAYGGSFKWAPVRRFDATVGAIYAFDEFDDPLLRDGAPRTATPGEPLQKSFTMYADGNWLFYPGDIELNGQIAVGRADTADVYRERAVNKVFNDAGLNVSSYSKIRLLMNEESRIGSLSAAELDEIFGGNTTMSRKAMRDSLTTLVKKAREEKKKTESDIDDDRVLGVNWGSQNFALGASLYWNIYKTTLSGHLKYVGEDYFSAGSPDQLSDTREFGGKLEQIITNFWQLAFGYQVNVENAANGSKTNIFGTAEGTHWGFFGDADDDWYEAHELDNDRAKYIHNGTLTNNFKIGDKVNLSVGYGLEYRTQYRPIQLHGNYILEEGVYRDDYFAPRDGLKKKAIPADEDSVYVDQERWDNYMSLYDSKFLASRFQERIFKNSWNTNVTIKAGKNTIKAGGIWTLRTDASKFHKDSLIKDMDLADTTWAKLGYFFGGADYFEQTYPISMTTNLTNLQNRVEVTPRFKSYNRDDMFEYEITVADEMEMGFFSRYLILSLNGEFRFLNTSWESSDVEDEETEIDVLGSVNAKLNHTKHLSTEWYTGAAMYYRPDYLSDEYKDIYAGVRLNYVF